ncbi:syntaxin-1B isoform X1 [Oryzias melastigma]|nr:syntaxin-1B isoform X1 [Oryzias melastigma]
MAVPDLMEELSHLLSSDMRDRLQHLQQAQPDPDGLSAVDLSEHEAAADPDLDSILQEAQRVRLEIQQIQNDVKDLKEANYHMLNKISDPGDLKRDSNAIGGDIKLRAEEVLRQLRLMNRRREELEARLGCSDPTARIARTQYQCLSSALREVMSSYNDTETNHRDACRRHIHRQMQVAGMEVCQEELEEAMEGGDVQVFSPHLQGKTASAALQQIQSRNQELLELERRIQAVQEVFLDVAMLVEEQGAAAENIEKNLQTSGVLIEGGLMQLERATASDKNNPFKKMFCGCFPCYHQ